MWNEDADNEKWRNVLYSVSLSLFLRKHFLGLYLMEWFCCGLSFSILNPVLYKLEVLGKMLPKYLFSTGTLLLKNLTVTKLFRDLKHNNAKLKLHQFFFLFSFCQWYFDKNYLCRGGSRAAATSKMEHFVIIVNGWKPLTIITKRSILDVVAALDPPLLCENRLIK